MEYERSRSRKAAGGECEECGRGAVRLVRHRQGWARRQGRAVLGLRRCPARLGCVADTGKRDQDFLIAALSPRDGNCHVPRPPPFQSIKDPINQRNETQGDSMLRTSICLAAVLLVAGSLHTASAQTAAPAPAATTPAPAAAKPSRIKLTHAK